MSPCETQPPQLTLAETESTSRLIISCLMWVSELYRYTTLRGRDGHKFYQLLSYELPRAKQPIQNIRIFICFCVSLLPNILPVLSHKVKSHLFVCTFHYNLITSAWDLITVVSAMSIEVNISVKVSFFIDGELNQCFWLCRVVNNDNKNNE